MTNDVIESWRGFFGSLKKEGGLNFAMEVRNKESSGAAHLQSFLRDYDIIPTGDSFHKEIQVSNNSRILYSRVFGLGDHTKWSFSTSELRELKEKIEKTPATRRYVTFHNITMYEDGARLKHMLKQEGHELLAHVTGVESLKEALEAEAIQFPASARELSSKLAWRTVIMPDGRRIHLNQIIDCLSETNRLDSIEQILKACSPVFASN